LRAEPVNYDRDVALTDHILPFVASVPVVSLGHTSTVHNGEIDDGHIVMVAVTLRQYPVIAIFFTLALGYYFGKFTFEALPGVGHRHLAGGRPNRTARDHHLTALKATVFLLFLFAVGYGVGPQFVRGVARMGCRQALSPWFQCVLCLESRSRSSS